MTPAKQIPVHLERIADCQQGVSAVDQKRGQIVGKGWSKWLTLATTSWPESEREIVRLCGENMKRFGYAL